jgi:hypothetical protein
MARKLVSFVGNNNTGAILVADVKSGDQILSVVYVSGSRPGFGPLGAPGQSFTTAFSSIVVTDGEILQSAGLDYSFYTFTSLIERKVML